MAITPIRAMTRNRPDRISSGFHRTVIGLSSLGSWSVPPRSGEAPHVDPPGRARADGRRRAVDSESSPVRSWRTALVTPSGNEGLGEGLRIGRREGWATPFAPYHNGSQSFAGSIRGNGRGSG